MATRNIEMNCYNGSSYDQLYPKTSYSNLTGTKPSYSFSEISGTLGTSQYSTIPINKGGTNGTTASAGLYNLISGLSTTSSLSSSYYFPLQYESSARRITVSNLLSYIESNINVGSGSNVKLVINANYIGTGAHNNYITWLPGTTSTDRNNICFVFVFHTSWFTDSNSTTDIMAFTCNGKETTSSDIAKYGVGFNLSSNATISISRYGFGDNFISSSGMNFTALFNQSGESYYAVAFAYVS